MRVKVKTADGQTIEADVVEVVDPANLPAGLLTEEDFEERFEKRFGRRATALERTTREKLLKDDAFAAELFAARGIDPTKQGGTGDGKDAERVQRAMEDLRRSEVAPLQGKLDELTGKHGKLLERMLESEIVRAAAEAGVAQRFLRPLTKGGTPLIVAALKGQFGYDAEHEGFFERNGKGEFVFAKDPNSGVPFRSVAESLRLFAEDKGNAEYLDKPRASGPGLETPGTGGRGGDVVLTAAEAADHAAYTAAEKRAGEAGGRVIVQ